MGDGRVGGSIEEIVGDGRTGDSVEGVDTCEWTGESAKGVVAGGGAEDSLEDIVVDGRTELDVVDGGAVPSIDVSNAPCRRETGDPYPDGCSRKSRRTETHPRCTAPSDS